MKTIRVSEEVLRNNVERLIKETKNADMYQSYKKHLCYNPLTNEFETTDWLSQGTTWVDDSVIVMGLETWDVRDRISDEQDYVFDAYDEINKTKINRDNSDWRDLKEDEDVAYLALEKIQEDYDISEDVDFNMNSAIFNLENNLRVSNYKLELI